MPNLTDVIGPLPYRMAFAGGWIDQPFISRLNPDGVGSMVVVALEPTVRFMDRAGMATGTRKVARRLWPAGLPDRDPAELVRELYAEENKAQAEPSGSQDMIGLIYPGISRLDFDARHENGLFPKHIESTQDVAVARWLERVVHMVPVAPRPAGYNPLGEKNLLPAMIAQLGRTGRGCYDAILARDVHELGASLNHCMSCWETLLPHTVRHPSLEVDLIALLKVYQSRCPGAMYSGCGGGYLYVISEEPVPGSFSIEVRLANGGVS